MEPVTVRGLEAREGETAFAFLVLRLVTAVDREGLIELIRFIAPLVPDAEAFIEELPTDLEESMRIVGVPWLPPDAAQVEVQRQLIDATRDRGVEAAWFFQTGTSLPSIDDDEDEDEVDDDEVEDDAARSEVASREVTGTEEIEIGPLGDVGDEDLDAAADDDDDDDDDEDDDEGDDDDDDEDDEDDATWSHGPPPQVAEVAFPVDGFPAIIDELDWEDFGIAFKMAGPALPGESTVLLGFHALWLAPYGGRYRNAAVTIDRKHHAAHLWIDRFASPTSAEEQVHHLLWIVSRLHEVTPIVHARFGGATMAQKYAGLMGDTSEPFVIGGNPLIAVYAERGEGGVDAWIDVQNHWSSEELAHMLRELAIEVVTQDDANGAGGGGGEGSRDEVDAVFDTSDEVRLAPVDLVVDDDAADDDDADAADAADDADDDDDDDAAGEGDEQDRGRHITSYAGEVLAERARAGLLDPRVADALRPSATSEKTSIAARA